MYHHTQRSPLHILLYLPAIFLFVAAWLWRANTPPSILAGVIAGVFLLLALSFQTLTVSEEEQHLKISYGPLNLFGTRIPFHEISQVEAGNTSWIDGWGIHFVPFRGWTFNLWGFECVKINRENKVTRIGTDDSEKLTQLLRERIEKASVG